MRSGGYYAAMRGSMTFNNDDVPEIRRGKIRVKLFNLLLEELGPRLLCRGILLTGERLQGLLAELPEQLRARAYRIDGRKLPVEQFRRGHDFPDSAEVLKLKVDFGDES